jgi:hypothetical protein
MFIPCKTIIYFKILQFVKHFMKGINDIHLYVYINIIPTQFFANLSNQMLKTSS